MEYSDKPVFTTPWIDGLKKRGAEFKWHLLQTPDGKRCWTLCAHLEDKKIEHVVTNIYRRRIFYTVKSVLNYWTDHFPEAENLILPTRIDDKTELLRAEDLEPEIK